MKNQPLLLASEGTVAIVNDKTEQSPNCSTCKGAMRHILRVLPETAGIRDSLDVYQCDNEPGMCEDWDPNSGGNSCVANAGAQIGDFEDQLSLDESVELGSFEEFCSYMDAHDDCVGVGGDRPVWIQGDETPTCQCGKVMVFALQIEEGANRDFNFGGGGCAYLFTCSSCNAGKFLWQC